MRTGKKGALCSAAASSSAGAPPLGSPFLSPPCVGRGSRMAWGMGERVHAARKMALLRPASVRSMPCYMSPRRDGSRTITELARTLLESRGAERAVAVGRHAATPPRKSVRGRDAELKAAVTRASLSLRPMTNGGAITTQLATRPLRAAPRNVNVAWRTIGERRRPMPMYV